MIIVKLWGGLGNQLFQFAFGYSLSQKYNQDLVFDKDFYSNQKGNMDIRKVRLSKLNIPNLKLVDRPQCVNFLENRYINHAIRYFPIFNVSINKKTRFIKEIKRDGSPIVIDPSFDYYLDGYWQSELYFLDYRNELLSMFSYSDFYSDNRLRLNNEILSNNSVALHIRRGDVLRRNGLKNVRHDLPLDYYYSSIDYIKKRVENPVFYIFSDDVSWVKNNINTNADLFFVECDDVDSDIADLWSIAQCKHGIMSASTFSWWGNWLRKEKGIVIAPTGEHFNKSFFPSDWVRI